MLRVLQERELERVGGEETIPVNVRIVVATNTPEDELVSDEGLRQDLFYRLHVVPITLPPLRERGGDIPILVEHFIEKLRDRTCSRVSSVSVEAIETLSAYSWPGNVRELENLVERALVMAEDEVLQAADIPPLGTNGGGVAGQPVVAGLPDGGTDLNVLMEGMEERFIDEALEQAGGVKAEAARLLGLKSSAFYYKLEKYGIEA